MPSLAKQALFKALNPGFVLFQLGWGRVRAVRSPQHKRGFSQFPSPFLTHCSPGVQIFLLWGCTGGQCRVHGRDVWGHKQNFAERGRQASQSRMNFILASWRDVRMQSNRPSELAVQNQVREITAAYLFPFNREQTVHEKKETRPAAKEDVGRMKRMCLTPQNGGSSRKYFCQQFTLLEMCVLANSK